MDLATRDMREARQRRILYFIFTLAMVTSAVICMGLLYAMGTPSPRTVALGRLERFAVGVPVDVPVRRLETSKLIPNSSTLSEDIVYVVKQADASYRALLAIDPTRGCLLNWQAAQRHYSGTCTTDTYTVNGLNQNQTSANGAHPTNMVELPATVRNDQVYIEDRLLRRDVQ